MRFIFYFLFLFSFNLWAQFEIKGKIVGYPAGEVVIKKYKGSSLEEIAKVFCNHKGNFGAFLDPYQGVLVFELRGGGKQETFKMLSDSIDIDFEVNIEALEKINFLKSPINKEVIKIKKNQAKLKVLQKPLNLYTSLDYPYGFYNCIKREINLLNRDLTPKSQLLNYYLELEEFINQIRKGLKNQIDPKLALPYKEKIIKIFNQDTTYLENSDKFLTLLIHYIQLSQLMYKSDQKVKEDLSVFLSQIGYETLKGQLVLEAFIDLFTHLFDKKEFVDFFISKSKACNCKFYRTLDEKIKIYESLKIGKIAPEIKFDNLIYGKVDKLSKLNSRYTVLFFWFSWCKHCKISIKELNDQYDFLKRKGFEVIGILLDEDKENILGQIKNRKWYNYKDVLGEMQKKYNISATPTFYLLDKDKKIKSKSHNLEDLINLAK